MNVGGQLIFFLYIQSRTPPLGWFLPLLVASPLLDYTSLESSSQTRPEAFLLGDSGPHYVDSIKYHTL